MVRIGIAFTAPRSPPAPYPFIGLVLVNSGLPLIIVARAIPRHDIGVLRPMDQSQFCLTASKASNGKTKTRSWYYSRSITNLLVSRWVQSINPLMRWCVCLNNTSIKHKYQPYNPPTPNPPIRIVLNTTKITNNGISISILHSLCKQISRTWIFNGGRSKSGPQRKEQE